MPLDIPREDLLPVGSDGRTPFLRNWTTIVLHKLLMSREPFPPLHYQLVLLITYVEGKYLMLGGMMEPMATFFNISLSLDPNDICMLNYHLFPWIVCPIGLSGKPYTHNIS